jgi:hypothetical protein
LRISRIRLSDGLHERACAAREAREGTRAGLGGSGKALKELQGHQILQGKEIRRSAEEVPDVPREGRRNLGGRQTERAWSAAYPSF